MKLVSVIVPVYNSGKYIEECITSIINQTYKNIEIIIINDNSSDNSLDIINKFKDKRIKIINLKKTKGVSNARNEGIKKSRGNYICYLDSDDCISKDKIEKQVKFMEDNNIIFSFTNFIYLKENGNKHYAKVPRELNYKKALKNTAILTSTVMLNMDILKKEDIFMPNIKKGQDTACWWRILKKGVTAYSMPEFYTSYRVHKNSLSFNKFSALKRTWNLYKLEDINYFKKMFCFICYAFNALKRRIL